MRAIRHFAIIFVKKLISSNCPYGTLGWPKKPCNFTRCRDLRLKRFCLDINLQYFSCKIINGQHDCYVRESNYICPNTCFYFSSFAENKRQNYRSSSNNKVNSAHHKCRIIQHLSKSGFGTVRCNSPQHA